MSRILRLQTLVCGLAAAPLAAQEAAAAGGDNVLILVADDMGVDCVGAYGDESRPPPTPNLDRLAARGVLFRNAWTNPVCSPTRACIMTGRYSTRTGVGYAIPQMNTGELRDEELTLPELIAEGNPRYGLAAIGKWHLTNPGPGSHRAPLRAGWEHFTGFLPGSMANYYRWLRVEGGTSEVCSTYATTQMVDDALTWIRRQQRPWVCYLAFTAPHGPWHPPPAHLHTRDLAGAGDPRVNQVPYYRAMVEALDSEIGRLLRSLGPDLDRTNVLFIGDNGTPNVTTEPPFVNFHGKGTPYEGGCNVPLIVAGPSVRSPGREVEALVGAVDLFATVAELAGVDVAATMPEGVVLDSVSMLPYLRDPSQTPLRETVFAEVFFGTTRKAMRETGFVAIRDRRYKFVRFLYPDEHYDELYDLERDPFELDDLLDGELTEEQAAARDRLLAEIERLRSS